MESYVLFCLASSGITVLRVLHRHNCQEFVSLCCCVVSQHVPIKHFVYSPVDEHTEQSQWGSYKQNCYEHLHMKFLYRHMLSFLLGPYLGVQWLDHMVGVHLTCLNQYVLVGVFCKFPCIFCSNTLSVNKDKFTSSLPNCMAFVSSTCL